MKQLTRADETLLVTIHCLGEDAYSTTILEELKERAAKKVTVGSLWVSLDGLADRGFVRKRPRPGDTGGRPRVYYALSPKGRWALKRSRDMQARLGTGVLPLD